MKRKIGFWKVVAKLVTRHWKSHLAFPFIVALVVEPLYGSFALKDQSIGQFMFSREGFISHASILSIIVTYLVAAFWYVHTETKASWTDISGEQLKVTLRDSVSFFATCTIPLENWFDPDIQKYFSDLVKQKYENSLPQNRVLLFKREEDLLGVNQQNLSQYHAKTLVSIHHNYKIPLGYLRPDEIGRILNNFTLTGKAAEWEKLKTMTGRGLRGTLSSLDFGLVKDKRGRHRVYTFDKTGDYIDLDVIDDAKQVQPYLNLRDDIWQQVFDQTNLPNINHDFAAYCGMPRLTVTR
ncbi:MAG TPA: hypothetical protein VK208_10720 [Pyrinomonadaceae bacterium]|nr:hypothetical protein [Pyrinomonadaceae bacterium]